MPISRTYPLSAPVVDSDCMAVRAIKDVPEYAPRNPDHSVAVVQGLVLAVEQAEDEYNRIDLAADAARRRFIDATWALHEAVLGVKAEVIAQFGPDSDAVKALGLTRKSDRKRPARRATSAE